MSYDDGKGAVLYTGDCIEVMRGLDAESVDAVVCDPPYSLEFMGRDWDRWRSPREFQNWCEGWASEAQRVLKPGGYMVAAGGSRTFHRLVAGIEDAGFEIRDCLTWHFGSGFPKSLDVSKALRSLPPCTCDVAGEVGTVGAIVPAGLVRAGSGTELGAVTLAPGATDGTDGVGTNVGPDTAIAGGDVQGGVKDVVGHDLPVVLRTGTVASVATGDDIAGDVGRVKVDPEPLRDDVVGDTGDAAAVGTRATGDDGGTDVGPAAPLVFPLPSTPGGVPLTGKSTAVGDGHAVPGTVDRDASAVAIGESPALGTVEGLHYLKCDTCGGVRRDLVPDGFGTALKPATEFMTLARKPLIGTVAANVLKHGTGALNIDASRIGVDPNDPLTTATFIGSDPGAGRTMGDGWEGQGDDVSMWNGKGRWPANLILSHAAGCVEVGTREAKTDTHFPAYRGASGYNGGLKGQADLDERSPGTESVAVYDCAPGCPVAEMDAQSGQQTDGVAVQRNRDGQVHNEVYGEYRKPPTDDLGYGGSGGASRFFLNLAGEPPFQYVAKASTADRNDGLDGERNIHPTCKPIALMRYLCKLVTPPGGTVLDPFAGSGTCGIAAIREGFDYVGIEKNPEYVEIAEARLAYARTYLAEPQSLFI